MRTEQVGARQGHTLFEVLVVVAVMLLVGFLTMPYIRPMMESNRLQSASDQLRARWAEFRARAIRDSRPYRFAYKANTGEFRLAPDSDDFWTSNSSTGGPATDGEVLIVQEKLPETVMFINTAAAASSTGAAAATEWTPAVTFLPDGTAAEDVSVTFGKEGTRPITLRLRGVTGTVTEVQESNLENP